MMNYELLDPAEEQIGIYASASRTPADIGDVIRIEHSDGIYFAEVIGIETGDAGEVLIFHYIKPQPEKDQSPLFSITRPFKK